MGLHPDLADKAHKVTIIGVDDNPVSLSGVKPGTCFQRSVKSSGCKVCALQWLYWYASLGMPLRRYYDWTGHNRQKTWMIGSP
jgi:hypothetical protein